MYLVNNKHGSKNTMQICLNYYYLATRRKNKCMLPVCMLLLRYDKLKPIEAFNSVYRVRLIQHVKYHQLGPH